MQGLGKSVSSVDELVRGDWFGIIEEGCVRFQVPYRTLLYFVNSARGPQWVRREQCLQPRGINAEEHHE